MALAVIDSSMTAVSLFSSGGVGDLALRQAGFDILASNELLGDRHDVFACNFPGTRAITGDIWKSVDSLEREASGRLGGRALTLLYATPSCQGMSRNGRGKLLAAIRAGRKPALDERNRLVVPVMELARRLRPEIVLLENVPEMAGTLMLDERGAPIRIVEFVERELGPGYAGRAEVVEFADYGVPQCRQRLISVFSRVPGFHDWPSARGTFMPPRTRAQAPDGLDGAAAWITVRDALEGLPPLDAKDAASATSDIPFHRVPLLDSVKHWWVRNTPEERSAFDNQCAACGFGGNPAHSARRDDEGINRASRETPIYCERCGELLPRPSVERNGRREVMRGYTSAYKRMSYDRPASALTRNLSYACSDNKLHPEQNRVLSLHEAFRLHTLDRYPYRWARRDGRRLSDKTIREIVGESIPPAGLQAIIDHLVGIRGGSRRPAATFGPLFARHGRMPRPPSSAAMRRPRRQASAATPEDRRSRSRRPFSRRTSTPTDGVPPIGEHRRRAARRSRGGGAGPAGAGRGGSVAAPRDRARRFRDRASAGDVVDGGAGDAAGASGSPGRGRRSAARRPGGALPPLPSAAARLPRSSSSGVEAAPVEHRRRGGRGRGGGMERLSGPARNARPAGAARTRARASGGGEPGRPRGRPSLPAVRVASRCPGGRPTSGGSGSG